MGCQQRQIARANYLLSFHRTRKWMSGVNGLGFGRFGCFYSWKPWHRDHLRFLECCISQTGSATTNIWVLNAASASPFQEGACLSWTEPTASFLGRGASVDTNVSDVQQQCPRSHSDMFPFWFQSFLMRISRQLFTWFNYVIHSERTFHSHMTCAGYSKHCATVHLISTVAVIVFSVFHLFFWLFFVFCFLFGRRYRGVQEFVVDLLKHSHSFVRVLWSSRT